MLDRPVSTGPEFVVTSRKPEAGSFYMLCCLSVVCGYLNVWLLVGSRHISATNLSWLIGDPAQYQVAWEFMRHQVGWHFPLTRVDDLGYPLGISAAYLDVIPLVAIPLRVISNWLPADFQYLGLFAVACHALQMYFGMRLVSRFITRDMLSVVVGGLFFLVAPVLEIRLLNPFGHYALSSQWVIVAGLYYYFSPRVSESFWHYMRPMLVLNFIGAAINPYISLFSVMISFAALMRARLEERRLKGQLIIAALVAMGITLVTLSLCGFLFGGDATKFAGGGYTYYSMNLLSPINPAQYPSIFIRQFPILDGQNEGYNYLGFGVLLLLGLAIARKPIFAQTSWRWLLPLLLFAIICTAFALSIKVTAGMATLYTLPLPQSIFNALASFRASGRLFWPAYYLIVLAAIVGAASLTESRRARGLILVAALGLQVADEASLRCAIKSDAQHSYTNPLQASEWGLLAKTHRHLVILPAWQCGYPETPGGKEAWYWFARLAARTGMTVNSYYAARVSAASTELNCKEMPAEIAKGKLLADTAYVLADKLVMASVTAGQPTHYCRKVDGFNLCTYDPMRASENQSLIEEILPERYQLGTRFPGSDWNIPRSVQVYGLDAGPEPWTVGPILHAKLRPAWPVEGDLRVDADFARALVTDSHPVQRVVIKVNGVTIGNWVVGLGVSGMQRSAVIPRALLRSGQVMVLTLEFPDAATPKSLGINEDGRLLAVAITALRISPDYSTSSPSK